MVSTRSVHGWNTASDSGPGRSASGRAPVPSGAITQMPSSWALPAGIPVNASREPSGDQAGSSAPETSGELGSGVPLDANPVTRPYLVHLGRRRVRQRDDADRPGVVDGEAGPPRARRCSGTSRRSRCRPATMPATGPARRSRPPRSRSRCTGVGIPDHERTCRHRFGVDLDHPQLGAAEEHVGDRDEPDARRLERPREDQAGPVRRPRHAARPDLDEERVVRRGKHDLALRSADLRPPR